MSNTAMDKQWFVQEFLQLASADILDNAAWGELVSLVNDCKSMAYLYACITHSEMGAASPDKRNNKMHIFVLLKERMAILFTAWLSKQLQLQQEPRFLQDCKILISHYLASKYALERVEVALSTQIEKPILYSNRLTYLDLELFVLKSQVDLHHLANYSISNLSIKDPFAE